MESADYYIGVDVGTASVRAGLVTSQGKVVGQAVKEVAVVNRKPDQYLQSSQQVPLQFLWGWFCFEGGFWWWNKRTVINNGRF